MKKLAFLLGLTSLLTTSQALSDPACPPHQKLVNGKCTCKKGYVRNGGVCKTCPDYSLFDCNRNICKCYPGFTWVQSQFKCQLKQTTKPKLIDNSKNGSSSGSGAKYGGVSNGSGIKNGAVSNGSGGSTGGSSPNTNYGPDANGNYKYSGYIDPWNPFASCPVNSFYNPPQYTCTCNYGMKWDSTGKNCIAICGVNEIFIVGKCICRDGFVRHFGEKSNCMSCPPGSHLNPPAYRCDCSIPSYQWNADKTKCVSKW